MSFSLIILYSFLYLYLNLSDMETSIKKRLPLKCPGCDHPLKVGRLFCESCGTEVCGTFDLPPLARLDDKEQAFVLDFVKSGGSLKEMSKTMGLSYPTVRNLLDDLIRKLHSFEN